MSRDLTRFQTASNDAWRTAPARDDGMVPSLPSYPARRARSRRLRSGADGAQSTLPTCADMLSLIVLSSDVISASGTTLMDSMTPIFRRRISSMFT